VLVTGFRVEGLWLVAWRDAEGSDRSFSNRIIMLLSRGLFVDASIGLPLGV